MTPEQRLLLYTVVKRKPSEVVAIGHTVPEARRERRTTKRLFVARNLLHVVGEFDVVDWPEVILCRFIADEGESAPAREAYLCTPEMVEKIIENVDTGRAKVSRGELTAAGVVEMERRAEEIIEAMDVVAGRKLG